MAKTKVEQALQGTEAAQVQTYGEKVSERFYVLFKDYEDRFKGFEGLLKRFKRAVDGALAKGWSKFNAIEEVQNEMCIARAILLSDEPVFTRLEYEPRLAGCGKSIDFRGACREGTVYFDVKTIAPKPTDRWEQFAKVQEENLLPDAVEVVLDKDWLGGELWHNSYAARGRMLEHALGLERKIVEGGLQGKDIYFALVLCGHEYHWHLSELEDFVFFYNFGFYGPGDPFSKLEARYIADNNIVINKSISRFACMFRSQGSIFPDRMIWRVAPTRYPAC